MTAVTVFQPNPKAVFRELEDGGVLLHLATGQYHGVNATGALVWKLLGGGAAPVEIAERLRDEVDDPPEDLAGPVAAFLDDLRRRDLVTPASPETPGTAGQ